MVKKSGKIVVIYTRTHFLLSLRGSTCQNLDGDARPIFLSLKFGQVLFSGLANSFAIFLGFTKFLLFLDLTNFQLFFWVLQFLYHTHLNPLNGDHTVLKNINHSSFLYLFKL